ncbi:MAG: NAD-glutamate dehydrogenase, partial [Nocardia sp.]|nr:NAD-glutamate dehydrogenase [Nocardia sp.]
MIATTQHTASGKRFHGDSTDLEAVYFRWIQPGAGVSTITDHAGRIYRHHAELAAQREPGTAVTRIYRSGDGSGLGPSLQIVNDDMPLLVDSLTAALRRWGATVAEVVHPVFDVRRDDTGRLLSVAAALGTDPARTDSAPGAKSGDVITESWIHVRLDSGESDTVLDRIARELPYLLDRIRRIDDDTAQMADILGLVALSLNQSSLDGPAAELAAETAKLLRWLGSGNFTLLGYHRHGQEPVDAGLGLSHGGCGVDLPAPVPETDSPDTDYLLRLSAGSLDSSLPGSTDAYVVSVADVDDPAIWHVFVGTFTVSGLHENILDIPVISRRVHQVLSWSGLALNSFSGQEVLELLQTFPRAELFSTNARRLFETASAVMQLGLRRHVRLFLRSEPNHEFSGGTVYCLVYMPRDRYGTEVRLRMLDILRHEFRAERITYSVRVSESELAVIYFTVHRRAASGPADIGESNRRRVQELLFATTRTWSDRVTGEAAGTDLPATVVSDYAAAFPAAYQQEYQPDRALADLRRLYRLPEGQIDTELYREPGATGADWRFTLYVAGAQISLSRVLPLLHSLGVEVLEEKPYRLELPDTRTRWIYDFGLRIPVDFPEAAGAEAGDDIRRRFPDAVLAMWSGDCEADGLNELIPRAGLHWRQVTVLRAYAKYLRQAGFTYTFTTITRVLLTHPAAARSFIELFTAHFDPEPNPLVAELISEQLRADIDAVVGLDADRILRAFHGLIAATLRTNYFRSGEQGEPPSYLSVKLDPQAIVELPRPRPLFEIFVYSPRVEGVHLRFGAVARGGLRWSDRLEDFRTEILG